MSLLSGCATKVFNCPELTIIPDSIQTSAVEELTLLPENSSIEYLLIDYLKTRDKLRACHRG